MSNRIRNKRKREPIVQLGDSSHLHMIGYNVAPDAGIVCLPVSAAMKLLFKIFDKWQVARSTQVALLRVSPSTLTRYIKGGIPRRRKTIECIEDILVTELMLSVLFPGQKHNVQKWLVSQNRAFDNMTPIEYAASNGTMKIRKYLESRVYLG